MFVNTYVCIFLPAWVGYNPPMRMTWRMWVLLGLLGVTVGLRVAWSTATLACGGHWDAVGPGLTVRTFYWKAPNVLVRVTAVRAEAGCPVRVVDRHAGVFGEGATAMAVCPPVGAAVNASAPTTGLPMVCAMDVASKQLNSVEKPKPFDQNSHMGVSAVPPSFRSEVGFRS